MSGRGIACAVHVMPRLGGGAEGEEGKKEKKSKAGKEKSEEKKEKKEKKKKEKKAEEEEAPDTVARIGSFNIPSPDIPSDLD
eukprot:2091216-Rhodomonas_salina.3